MSSVVGLAISGAAHVLGRGADLSKIDVREALLAVVISWIFAAAAAGLPYLFSGVLEPFDAFFEGASGITTTGASVIVDLSIVPRSILLWRSFSQWIGGIGIIVITLAFFRVSGAAIQLFKAEVTGPVRDKLTPRVQKTAAFMLKAYVIITLAQLLLLAIGGLDIFDAAALSLATAATGGFMPYAESVGHFSGPFVKIVVAFFLILASTNITDYHSIFVKRSIKDVLNEPEIRFFIFILALFSFGTTMILWTHGTFPTFLSSAYNGIFHSISMISTCGFFTTDYSAWPSAARHLLLIMMLIGGCAISTSGGITCARTAIIMRHTKEEFVRLMHPRAVIPVRFGSKNIKDEVVAASFAFFVAYLIAFLLGTVALAMTGQDLTTALSSAASTLGNVGPGFGLVSPTFGYAAQNVGAKSIYIVLMFFGRLEIFTIMAIFSKSWRVGMMNRHSA